MIDLHTHSTHSDGSLTPARLIDLAATQGLRALSLTDHDVISGNIEAALRAAERGIQFLPGVELEIASSHSEFHLLGLDLQGDLSELEKRLCLVREHRTQRNHSIIEKMNRDGIPVSLEDLGRIAKGEIISRLHIAQYLVAKQLASSISDAFEQYLRKGKPYFAPKQALNLTEAVALIHTAGGKAIIAHPYSLKLEWNELSTFLMECRHTGLDGLEAYHSDYRLADCLRLEAFGQANGFIITAGSDFHGAQWPSRRLGYSSEGMPIDGRFLSWPNHRQC